MFYKPDSAYFQQRSDILAPLVLASGCFSFLRLFFFSSGYATVNLETVLKFNYYIPMLQGGERKYKEEE